MLSHISQIQLKLAASLLNVGDNEHTAKFYFFLSSWKMGQFYLIITEPIGNEGNDIVRILYNRFVGNICY